MARGGNDNRGPIEFLGVTPAVERPELHPPSPRTITRREALLGGLGLVGAVVVGSMIGHDSSEVPLTPGRTIETPHGTLSMEGWRIHFDPTDETIAAESTRAQDGTQNGGASVVLQENNFRTVGETVIGDSARSASSGAPNTLEVIPVTHDSQFNFWVSHSERYTDERKVVAQFGVGRSKIIARNSTIHRMTILSEGDVVDAAHVDSLRDVHQVLLPFGTYRNVYITNPSQVADPNAIYSGVIPERDAIIVNGSNNREILTESELVDTMGLGFLFGAVRLDYSPIVQHENRSLQGLSEVAHPALDIETYLAGQILRDAVDTRSKGGAWAVASTIAVLRYFPDSAMRGYDAQDIGGKQRFAAQVAATLDFIALRSDADIDPQSASTIIIPEIPNILSRMGN